MRAPSREVKRTGGGSDGQQRNVSLMSFIGTFQTSRSFRRRSAIGGSGSDANIAKPTRLTLSRLRAVQKSRFPNDAWTFRLLASWLDGPNIQNRNFPDFNPFERRPLPRRRQSASRVQLRIGGSFWRPWSLPGEHRPPRYDLAFFDH